MKVRMPAHAGTFYPGSREALVNKIKWSFTHRLGPGKLPGGVGGDRLSYAYIVPHAGYDYSGPTAAHAYFEMAGEKPPEVVVLLGPNHTGLGLAVSVYREGAWRTPLGDVNVDSEVSRLMVEYSGFAAFDEKAHIYEHSLEVQLPFLQYIYGGAFKIVPIIIMAQTISVSRGLAEAFLKVVHENGVDALMVATSDLNHYEPHDVSVKKDLILLEEALKPNPEGLFHVAEKFDISACGLGPMASAIYIAKIKNVKPELLAHSTSGDVTGEKDWVVGYSSLRVKRG